MIYYMFASKEVANMDEWSAANDWIESKLDPILGDQSGSGTTMSMPMVRDWNWETNDRAAAEKAVSIIKDLNDSSWDASFTEFPDEDL